MKLGLIKTFAAGGSIAANSLVKFSADGIVVQATAATDNVIGVCVQPGGAASGAPCDVQLTGIADVKMGGVVARGAPVTADSSGYGVAPAPGAGVNNRVLGFAMATTASGDIAEVLIYLGFDQGAGLA
jgi:Uncharacterized conserved protein (DUF2190)